MDRLSPVKKFDCKVPGCGYTGRSQGGLNAHQKSHAPRRALPPPPPPGPQGAVDGAGRIREEDSDEDEDDENWLGAVEEEDRAGGKGEVGKVRGLLFEDEGG